MNFDFKERLTSLKYIFVTSKQSSLRFFFKKNNLRISFERSLISTVFYQFLFVFFCDKPKIEEEEHDRKYWWERKRFTIGGTKQTRDFWIDQKEFVIYFTADRQEDRGARKKFIGLIEQLKLRKDRHFPISIIFRQRSVFILKF